MYTNTPLTQDIEDWMVVSGLGKFTNLSKKLCEKAHWTNSILVQKIMHLIVN